MTNEVDELYEKIMPKEVLDLIELDRLNERRKKSEYYKKYRRTENGKKIIKKYQQSYYKKNKVKILKRLSEKYRLDKAGI